MITHLDFLISDPPGLMSQQKPLGHSKFFTRSEKWSQYSDQEGERTDHKRVRTVDRTRPFLEDEDKLMARAVRLEQRALCITHTLSQSSSSVQLHLH